MPVSVIMQTYFWGTLKSAGTEEVTWTTDETFLPLKMKLLLDPSACIWAASLFFTLFTLPHPLKFKSVLVTLAQSFPSLPSSASVACALNLSAFLSFCLSELH